MTALIDAATAGPRDTVGSGSELLVGACVRASSMAGRLCPQSCTDGGQVPVNRFN